MEILPNHFIFKEAEIALMQGKSVSIRVVGKSMEPFLLDNKDIVKIAPCISSKLCRGDVVLFKTDTSYCLHRVISIKGEELTLCGDGIYQFGEIISTSKMIGVLHSVIRQSGTVVVCNSLRWKMPSKVWMALFFVRKYLLYLYRKW